MKIIVVVLTLILVFFSSGCTAMLSPFIAKYIQYGRGLSALNDLGVWAPIIGLVALPMIISGAATLFCILSRDRVSSATWRSRLIAIDFGAILAFAGYILYLLSTSGVRDRSAMFFVSVFALIVGLKSYLQYRLSRGYT